MFVLVCYSLSLPLAASAASTNARLTLPADTINGARVEFCVQVTHDAGIEVRAVSLQAVEQVEKNPQRAMLTGFIRRGEIHAEGGRQVEDWVRLADTRGDFNTITPLKRDADVAAFPLFNSAYRFEPSVTCAAGIVATAPAVLPVCNLNIAGVHVGSEAHYLVMWDPAAPAPPFTFSIEDAGKGYSYRWRLYLWPVGHRNTDECVTAVMEDVATAPGRVTIHWNGKSLAGTPMQCAVVYDFDIAVTKCTDAKHPEMTAVDSQWYRATGAGIVDDVWDFTYNRGRYKVALTPGRQLTDIRVRILNNASPQFIDLPQTANVPGWHEVNLTETKETVESSAEYQLVQADVVTSHLARDHTNRPAYTQG